jgi:hypothetical protein
MTGKRRGLFEIRPQEGGGRNDFWQQQVCSKKRSVFRELLETPLKNLSSLTRTKIGPHGSNLKPFETG